METSFPGHITISMF